MNNLRRAVVIAVADPRKMGRVKVVIPDLLSLPSDWAPVLRPFDQAKPRHGPRVDDVVLVGFEGDDLRQPVVLGLIQRT